MGRQKIVLTAQQEEWLKTYFPCTTNEECAKELGMSRSAVIRFARQFGLEKTPEFMYKMQCANFRKATAIISLRGYPPKGYIVPESEKYRYKKGESIRQRLGEERDKERIRKARESLIATRKRERARVTFGLEQKTKLKVISQPREKISARYWLRKRGYIVDDDARIVYYTDSTIRGKIAERNHSKWWRFEPLPVTKTISQ